ncbi:transglutaminase-like domain-containing protein [Thermophagus sp. OGC60D27]|uniref:transglutaminase-like domain-containing protein n=1 Tax=Thermophagus sp. OGC60D27 TaxID=3458415 RepID=UPI0040383892
MVKYLIILVVLSGFLFSCEKKDTIFRSEKIHKTVMENLEEQQKLASGRFEQLFSVFDEKLTSREEQALSFLFAYMPLSDLSNYDGHFFLEQVRYSLRARDYFKWGKRVPSDLFLHYVLPCRVNNEYLDTARKVFFEDLKERLIGLSMREAALEINHWCHERVTYQSTDGYRTSSPMNTIKTAFGRCGEQSTLTVSALRAVGIPARQIYTPRWAHTDDNHAWVEVWVDGQWYYMGACEPEPELDMGWFEGPATRAMLLHHKAYGHIPTMEKINSVSHYFTEINVLNRYAPVRNIIVKVLDEGGIPVKGANVQFKYPNYAELYPLATVITNDEGVCNLMTGNGDLLVWSRYEGQFAWKKSEVADRDTLVLFLGSLPKDGSVHSYLFHAPPPSVTPDHSNIDRTNHIKRLHSEDSIRAAYEQTFIDSVAATATAMKYNLDREKILLLFKQSRGNWKTIKQFLDYAAPKDPAKAIALLSVISPKDRRDTPLRVLKDHFDNSDNPQKYGWEFYVNYVLNPRVGNELISEYKGQFQKHFTPSFQEEVRRDIRYLLDWGKDSITIRSKANPWGVPQMPIGVLEMKVADKNSLNIFFISVARSFGLAARIDAVRNQPQIYQEGEWVDINFEKGTVGNSPKGILELKFDSGSKTVIPPGYFKDFTLAKFTGKEFVTLDYSNSNLFEKFPVKLDLDEGVYSLTTVRRLSDGSVRTRVQYFQVLSGKQLAISVIIPELQETKKDVVNFEMNLNTPVQDFLNKQEIMLEELVGENGMVIIWLDLSLEPSKHLLNDLIRLRSNFNNWKGNIALLLNSEKLSKSFSLTEYQGLPSRSIFLIDHSAFLFKDYQKKRGGEPNYNMPLVLVLNSEQRVIYESTGYRIGIGDEVLGKVIEGCIVP